jgi:hypothetical protein
MPFEMFEEHGVELLGWIRILDRPHEPKGFKADG